MSTKTMKTLSIIYILIGLIDSIYLTWIKYAHTICGVGDCDTVNASQYSELFGIPIAVFGAATYLVLLLVILLKNRVGFLQEYGVMSFFGITLVGFLYSVYLSYIELAVLDAICPFCVLSAIMMFLLFDHAIIDIANDMEMEG